MPRDYVDSSMKICLVTSGDAKFPTVLYIYIFRFIEFLLPWLGASSCCEWKIQHADMEGGYEYIE